MWTMRRWAWGILCLGSVACLATPEDLDGVEGPGGPPSQGIQIGEEDCGNDLIWVRLVDADGVPIEGTVLVFLDDWWDVAEPCDGVCAFQPPGFGDVQIGSSALGEVIWRTVQFDEEDAVSPGEDCNWHEEDVLITFD
jgi:hypothetical protein